MFFHYLVLAIVLGAVLVSLLYTVITGISPVSSSYISRKRIVNTIPLDQEGIIYELGAGWGALAFPLARRCPRATVVAYELSPVPWLCMKIRSSILGPGNLKVVRRDFLREDLSGASLVICYLYPGAMTKLSAKLFMELRPKTQVISNTFEIPSWTPSIVQSLEDVMCPQIFYYKMESAITSVHQLIDVLWTIII